MDVGEVHRIRGELALKLVELLNEFQNRTGMQIVDITLNRMRHSALRADPIESVDIEVKLP